jgi:hypothetical protein
MKIILFAIALIVLGLCPSCSFDPSARSTVLDTLKFEVQGQYDIDGDGIYDTDTNVSIQPFK